MDSFKPQWAARGVVIALWLLGGHAHAQTSILSSQPAALNPESTPSTPMGNSKRIDFAFQSIPVRALLQVMGETAGVNIVADDSVTGTMTLNLKGATWQEALDTIARSKNLRIETVGNTVYVRSAVVTSSPNAYTPNAYNTNAPNTSYAPDAYATPMVSEAMSVQYQKAEDIRAMLSRDGQRMTSEKGAVTVDSINNQLIVFDTPERIAQIRRLLARVDKPGRQVLIEARIVEAEDSFSRSLGVKLGFNDLSRIGFTKIPHPTIAGETINVPVRAPSSGAMFGGSLANTQTTSGQYSNTIGLGQVPSTLNNMINLPAAASTSGTDPASFALSLFNANMTRFINLEISALESDGKGKTVANPRVVTSNNIKAIMEQGTEIPYVQLNALGATNTSFRKANLKLEVTPQISPNGEVLLDVDVTKDSVGTYTREGYTIDTKHVKTQVKIDNGGTLVIGGIYQESNRNGVDKVPILGDIPLLGNLFRSSVRATDKRELLIFLTPHILDARGNIQINRAEKITVDN